MTYHSNIIKKIYHMKLWNKNICLTSSRAVTTIIAIALFSSILIASAAMSIKPPLEKVTIQNSWTPTTEDIQYQDSMFQIIRYTQLEVDTINDVLNVILYKLERLEYNDGSYDSIRYVEGGNIDRSRNN